MSPPQKKDRLKPALWSDFFDKCFKMRLRGAKFENPLMRLYQKSPVPGLELVNNVLDHQTCLNSMLDPLVVIWLDTLLNLKLIDNVDLLDGVYRHSRHSSAQHPEQVKNAVELEPFILEQVARRFHVGKVPSNIAEARGSLRVLANWMLAISTPNAAIIQDLDQHTNATTDGIGALALAMLANPRMMAIIDRSLSKSLSQLLYKGLTSFVGHWSQSTSPHAPNATHLEMAFKQRQFAEIKPAQTQDENAMDVAAALQIESTTELPIVHARASTFVFLNALMAGRHLVDDEPMILNWLHMRYKGDLHSLGVSLILASFDTLSSAVARKEPSDAIFALKSFLINKVPPLLSILDMHAYAALSTEVCITDALQHVDPAVFPSESLNLMQDNDLGDVRQEFLFSCSLHGRLRVESVTRLLGEQPLGSIPTLGDRLVKDDLVAEFSNNAEKAQQFLEKLEKLDGNASAISNAISQVIRTWCSSRYTSALKSISNYLIGKVSCIDVLLQFVSPATLLQPICQLLDSWKYEDDQDEFQPVYDEFASIFLLVLTVIYHCDLSYQDLAIGRDSFVAKYLDRGHQSIPTSELTELQAKQVGVWINGVFNTDAIPDEVMAACRPQEFYILVPTIFKQIVHATAHQIIHLDTLKTPLEYFIEPFLLPSLVGAVHWMASQWYLQEMGEINIILFILFKTLPAANDIHPMHQAVVSIVSLPLSRFFRKVPRRNPKQRYPLLDKLMAFIQPRLHFRRSIYLSPPEFKSWLLCPGSLKQAIQDTFQSLIEWSSPTTLQPLQSAVPYTHRSIHLGTLLLGAPEVLSILLDTLRTHTSMSGAPAFALDIATAIICSPTPSSALLHTPTSWPGLASLTPSLPSPTSGSSPYRSTPLSARLSLRDALTQTFSTATQTLKKDTLLAESIVRLHRRVEAQLSASLPTAFGDLAGAMGAMPDDAEAAAVVAAVAAGEAGGVPINFSGADASSAAIDLGADAGGMGLNLGTGADGLLDGSGVGGAIGGGDEEDWGFAMQDMDLDLGDFS